MTECCRCGQPGQLAKDCRAATYNLSDTTYEQRHDNTAQWYDHVLPKQWLRCQLVLWPNGLLPVQWATVPAAKQTPQITTTCADSATAHNSAGTTGASNTSCVSTGQQDVSQQHHWHQHFSQSKRMKPKSTLWSTVKQQQMFARQGSRPTHSYCCTCRSMD